MAIIQDILNEEIKRIEKNISFYESHLKSLPKGSIFIRKMGNSMFVYRKIRYMNKVISEYLGKDGSPRAIKEINHSNEYHRIKENLRVANNELVKLMKAYRIVFS